MGRKWNHTLAVLGLATLLLAACGGGAPADDAHETKVERANSIQQAFGTPEGEQQSQPVPKPPSGDGPPGRTVADIQAYFDAISKRMRNHEGVTVLFDVERMLMDPYDRDYRPTKDAILGVRGSIKNSLEKQVELFNKEKYSVRRVEELSDGGLLVYVRQDLPGFQKPIKTRWWLVQHEDSWRIWDFEGLDGGIRTSRLLSTLCRPQTPPWGPAVLKYSDGVKSQSMGDFKKALTHFEAAKHPQLPPDLEAMRLVGCASCKMLSGDVAAALKLCNNAVALQTDCVVVLYVRGSVHFQLKEYEKSYQDFMQYVSRVGSDYDALCLAADSLTWIDRHEEAEKLYRASLADRPNMNAIIGLAGYLKPDQAAVLNKYFLGLYLPGDQYLPLVKELWDERGLLAATKAVNEAYGTIGKHDINLAWYRAQVAVAEGDHEAAAAALRPAIARVPVERQGDFLHMYWNAMAWSGKSLEALKEYVSSREAFGYLCGLAYDDKDAELLEQLCEQWFMGHEDDPLLHFYFGEADYMGGQYEAALVHFRTGLSLHPLDPDNTEWLRAGAVDCLGYLGKALEAYEAYPPAGTTILRLVPVLVATQDAAGLQKLADAHAAKKPDSRHCNLLLGSAAWLNKRWPECADLLTAYVVKAPADEVTWDVRHQLFRSTLRAGRFELALKQVSELEPDADWRRFYCTVVHICAGDAAAAVAALESLTPDLPVKHALLRLYGDADAAAHLKTEALAEFRRKFPAPPDEKPATGNEQPQEGGAPRPEPDKGTQETPPQPK